MDESQSWSGCGLWTLSPRRLHVEGVMGNDWEFLSFSITLRNPALCVWLRSELVLSPLGLTIARSLISLNVYLEQGAPERREEEFE